ncbi:polysaccharide biosynthesis protein [Paenibacillus thalictri]|uniref:Polysaccharide biosynthesis protein n=1 Tax=Paenibacillus thalictri TaxID=2527873 RepID=A0A4Q9DC70_9BACL|nr:polysaccharide biosynthesis protein [Paenibacillus thalictri]TBL67785.1 polysaccharide biosynthesis protein [Paenibacillus thalictri]
MAINGFFKNRKILIIGGTGTIGKSILLTLLKDEPEVVRIFSRDEYKQFELENELGYQENIRYLIGDVRDCDRVRRAMQDIDYVFHVAAMKHVPSCEYNPYEAVLTNIIGTNNVIQAAINSNVKKVVFTSTDKAISPTNTYGATKLTAERLIAAAHYNKGKSGTVFAAVRFGNVMGSRGSVIPLFEKQILSDRKITITDMDMTRFMMTLNQATKLTIQSLVHSTGGEIFVLKMPVIKLSDLAEVVIDKCSFKHNIPLSDIQIVEIGLRPGEKYYEELMTFEESKVAVELSHSFVIPSPFVEQLPEYEGGIKARLGTYSSENIQPISIDELKKIIENERLL